MTNEAAALSDEQIKHLTNRFLQWKLPADFRPDNGISVARPNYAPEVAWEPVGTNLLNYTQAEAMVRFMVEGMPALRSPGSNAVEGERWLEAYVSQDARVIGIDHPTDADWQEVLAAHIALLDRLNVRIAEQEKCAGRPASSPMTDPEQIERDGLADAGCAWLREQSQSCKDEAISRFERDDEEAGEEWRVRGETYGFVADQVERGLTPFTVNCGDPGAPLCSACTLPVTELVQQPGCGAPVLTTDAATIARLREAGSILAREAVLLLNNAEGCARDHYGSDLDQFGMPAWLVDCRNYIQEARAALAPAKEGE